MKRILITLLTLLTIACGGDADRAAPEPTEEQSQAVTTTYTVSNGSKSTTNTNGKFCRLNSFNSKGGHWSSPVWPNGYYKNGTLVSVADGSPSSNGTLLAKVYGGPAQPPGRTVTSTAACNPYADYGFGWAASQSTPSENLNVNWGPSSQEHVTADKDLGWLADSSFCYLNGFDSVSGSGESLRVVQSAASATWRLIGSGYPKLAGFAKCVFPHRAFTVAGPFRATTAVPIVAGPDVSNSFCALTMVAGSADDGSGTIFQEDGKWKLYVASHLADQFLIVEMTCAVF